MKRVFSLILKNSRFNFWLNKIIIYLFPFYYVFNVPFNKNIKINNIFVKLEMKAIFVHKNKFYLKKIKYLSLP